MNPFLYLFLLSSLLLLSLQSDLTFDRLLNQVRGLPMKTIAVSGAAGDEVLKSVRAAKDRDLFQVQLNYPEGIEIEEIQSKLLSPMTSVLSTQNAKAQSETKNLAVPAGPSLVLLLSSRESVSRKET